MTTQSLNNVNKLCTKNEEVIKNVFYVLHEIESDRLVKQVNDIYKIHSFEYEKLKRTANIILKMATSDQKFGLPCACICAALQNLQVPYYSKDNVISKIIKFKDIIVHRSLLILRSAAWDESSKSEHNYIVAKCRFICEMYHQQIITSSLIILSLQTLITSNISIHIESACYIMMVIGKDLSHNVNFSKLFESLKKLLTNTAKYNISNSVCLLVVDLVNLEGNHWKWNDSDLNTKEKQNLVIESKEIIPAIQKKINVEVTSSNMTKYVAKSSSLEKQNSVIEPKELIPAIQNKINVEVTSSNMTKYVAKSSSLEKDEQMFKTRLKKLNYTDVINFEEIFCELSINKSFLTRICCIIIEQAHLNPELISMYVKLCSIIHNEFQSKYKLPCDVSFKKIIIDKCNCIFHENCKQNEKKNVKKTENFSIRRKQTISHCQFIAELYMKEIISHKNIVRLIKKLFNESIRRMQLEDELNKLLECICAIILIAGRKLDEKSNSYLSTFYEQFRLFLYEYINIKISNDVQSKIHHLFNLRINNWDNEKKLVSDTSLKNVKQTLETNNKAKKIKLEKNKLKLDRITNPWLPKRLSLSTKNENIDLVIEKKVQGILNKVTIQNVDFFSKVLTVLMSNSFDFLKKLVVILTKQVLSDPYHCPDYAELCSKLKNVEVPCGFNESTGQVIMSVSFHEVLVRELLDLFDLVECQVEDTIKLENENTKSVQNYVFSKNQNRLMANCRFMLELLKRSVITSDVILNCFKKLILRSKRNEGFLECVYYFSSGAGLTITKYGLEEQLFQLIDLHHRKNEIQLSKKNDILLNEIIKLLLK